MMDVGFIRMLFDYHYWARDRVLNAANGLSEGDYAKDNGFTYGSIRGILTHMASAEVNAQRRWRKDETPGGISQDALPTVEALQARWKDEEQNLRSFLAGLTDEALMSDIVTTGRDGVEFRRPLYVDLVNQVTHGSQHRSEAAEALTMVGRSPGNLDLQVFYRER